MMIDSLPLTPTHSLTFTHFHSLSLTHSFSLIFTHFHSLTHFHSFSVRVSDCCWCTNERLTPSLCLSVCLNKQPAQSDQSINQSIGLTD